MSRGETTVIRILLRHVCPAVLGSTRLKQALRARTVYQAQQILTMTRPLYVQDATPAFLQTLARQCVVRAPMVSMTMTLMLAPLARAAMLASFLRLRRHRVLYVRPDITTTIKTRRHHVTVRALDALLDTSHRVDQLAA